MKQVRNILTRVRGNTPFDPFVVPLGYLTEIIGKTFWVHRTTRGEGMRPLAKHLTYWTVTEPETGMAVYMSNSPETRSEAVKRATTNVSAKGIDVINELIRRSKQTLADNGVYDTTN